MIDPAQLHTGSSNSTVRGLATVAMLKANFDVGRDHIAMFEPFVRDAVASFEKDDMDREEMIGAVLSRHGLKLPENTMRTLLNRLVRHGYLTREGGRYFRTEKDLTSDDVVRSRARAEERQRRLALGLIDSAAKRKVKIDSPGEALGLIMSFMESYHVKLAFDEPPDFDGVNQEDTVQARRHVATALFLRDAINAEGEFSDVVQETLEGFVLQNTLLLKDISTAGRQFDDLEVILDSHILFGALGSRGKTTKKATVEFLELLRQTGARLTVFRPTLEEMERILVVYERKIGTSKGRETLHPGDLTRHFLTEKASPADIKELSALLEFKLKKLRITIRDLPDRVPKWTMDEGALAKDLADESGRDDKPRVLHDVDCVAAVLAARKGRTSNSLDSCGAIFVTDSGMTVQHTNRWYKREGGKGLAPIIHELSLSNFAWLKRPESAAKLKVHELVALCSAALRPAPPSWERFVQHLRDLEDSGDLSSDEVAAVVASELTQNALAEAVFEDESDAETLSDVVARVKADLRKESDAVVSAANKRAEESSAEVERLRAQFRKRAAAISRVISLVAATILACSLIAGTAISLIQAVTGEPPSVLALVLAVVPLALFSLAGAIWGFHLQAARQKFESSLAKQLEVWMLRDQPPSRSDEDEDVDEDEAGS